MYRNLTTLLAIFIIISRLRLTEGKLSTLPSLGHDLQALLDTLYDKGYQPQYLHDISDNEKSDGEYLEFPDFNSSQESPGALNQPSWLNYQKEVFVPPESEYKNIIPHPHKNVKIVPLHCPSNNMDDDDLWESFDPQEVRADSLAQLNEEDVNITRNITDLDFLLPIPENLTDNMNMLNDIGPKTIHIPMKASNNESSQNNTQTNVTEERNFSSIQDFNNHFKQKPVEEPTTQNSTTSTEEARVYKWNKINDNDTNTVVVPHSRETVYEVQVQESPPADNASANAMKQHKNKFSLLNLFHKKNYKSNLTLVENKEKEKQSKYGPDTKKKIKARSLQELYEQLVHREDSESQVRANWQQIVDLH